MTKQIQVPDDVYNALCSIAESHGHSIKPGRGSGMVATLREMCELFKPIECGDMSKSWARFNARIIPALNSLVLEATRHHERVDISFSVSRGLRLKRVIEHPTPPPQEKPSDDDSTAILEGRKVEERRKVDLCRAI